MPLFGSHIEMLNIKKKSQNTLVIIFLFLNTTLFIMKSLQAFSYIIMPPSVVNPLYSSNETQGLVFMPSLQAWARKRHVLEEWSGVCWRNL